ncbi:MAG: Mrp/NBP35 family ATP-binding protein [Gammaproteobacteria bacterium]|nr:Mrp/NBP35 family ATP-binding protein [Gammaproteobacteria bacterium]
MLTKADIEAKLSGIVDPYLGQDWLSTKRVVDIAEVNDTWQVSIALGYPAEMVINELKALAARILPEVNFSFSCQLKPHSVQPGLKSSEVIKNVIAVGSGKGGVGKSTTAVALARALKTAGAKVGLLDADIYGPNLPHMLGANGLPERSENKKFKPVYVDDMPSMSIGYLMNQDTPMVWRGPMISQALTQLWNDTLWPELDYLIVDLPPGTGDIQLTLAKKIPVTGSVIVTTPQDVALLDAQKAIAMFNKVNVKVLGVVENMSEFQCPHCEKSSAIFGKHGGRQLAEKNSLRLLGQVPLTLDSPTMLKAYQIIALKTAAELSLLPRDYAHKFAKVVVE